MNKLPAPLALKKYIVEYADKQGYSGFSFSGPLDTETEIQEAYNSMYDQIGCDAVQDVIEGHFETTIQPAFSRHFEVESVAIKDNYDNYIGFSRFYGGGKHSDVYSTYHDSIENAYYLLCSEEEVLTIQRTWTKVE